MTPVNTHNTVICDNGTGYVKAGFAGQLYPVARVPSVVGRPLGARSSSEPGLDFYVGDQCSTEEQWNMAITCPISNGIVSNWEDMQCIWSHVFDHMLKVSPPDNRILLSEPPLSTKESRAVLLETMFEKFGFRAVSIQPQPVLALYSQGLVSGLVIDSGASLTHIVPVVGGVCDQVHIKRLPVAGEAVERRLADLLNERGYTLPYSASASLRHIKEKCCFVAIDMEREKQLARETTALSRAFKLPDDTCVRVSEERVLAPEALFQPHVLGYDTPGLSHMVHECIHDMPIDMRLGMYQKILLAGGTTMLPGLSSRLEIDLQALYLQHVLKGRKEGLSKLKIRFEEPPLRRHLVYTGASILGEVMAEYEAAWVTRAEYAEDPTRALQRCSVALQEL